MPSRIIHCIIGNEQYYRSIVLLPLLLYSEFLLNSDFDELNFNRVLNDLIP